jgi:hypothetical protein
VPQVRELRAQIHALGAAGYVGLNART